MTQTLKSSADVRARPEVTRKTSHAPGCPESSSEAEVTPALKMAFNPISFEFQGTRNYKTIWHFEER